MYIYTCIITAKTHHALYFSHPSNYNIYLVEYGRTPVFFAPPVDLNLDSFLGAFIVGDRDVPFPESPWAGIEADHPFPAADQRPPILLAVHGGVRRGCS